MPARRAVLKAVALAAVLPDVTARAEGNGLQPYASYWFPDSLPSGTPAPGVRWRSLAQWRPEEDAELPFNRSATPLAPRFTPPPGNSTAHPGQARISALVSFAPTSGNPSLGSGSADYYALTNWAYLDELVFWGGSSGEGLILAPNAPVIDAAHRNGVPVLGTVFLPPTAYGGQLAWTRELVRRDPDGRFPLADQLVLVARTHGFDGWFLNAETDGGDHELGAAMRDFTAYLRRQGQGLRITWYDAMAISGEVAWQNELNDNNAPFFRAADTIFLNFGWTRSGLDSSARLAESLGRGRYELWAGVDVEARGWDTPVDWDAIAPPGTSRHTTSIGFYRPEWTWKSLSGADRSPAAFHRRDDRFWAGDSALASWRAPAAIVADRSTITSLPFATTFNTGHGLAWYEDGGRVSDAPWNQLGLQDRLPARRWSVHTVGQRPDVGFDFGAAWHGGSSLLVSGRLTAPTTIDLYSTRLPLSSATVIALTHRADPGSTAVLAELVVGAGGRTVSLPLGRLNGHNWTTSTIHPQPQLRGATTIDSLGIRLTASATGTLGWRLGALAVCDTASGAPGAPGPVRRTAGARNPDGTVALRLAWGAAPGPVRHYELRQSLPGGGFRFLGGTCGHAYYVPALRRTSGEAVSRLEVRALDELYVPSPPAVFDHRW
ncbi:endo-beta-N-acetylglucosaminidase [Streptomyces orinoci]|uniref:Endo-beta-N-acetylglucosaminidase n=1 Tax=Streptomyces orinoci TaxID=67339 RepID=A0ABV3JRS8_STRON|nr:endo-beta-N-acetylglucosaminidase [Streptomyces orinoci]